MVRARALRARWSVYMLQLRSLGPRRWVHFKLQLFRSRAAAAGDEYRISTPLAQHSLAFRAKTSDIKVFTQIFVHQEYQGLAGIGPVDLVIDCGANVGYSSAFFLTKYPHAQVIAIEPDPDNYSLLCKNVAAYGERCLTLHSALWSHSTGLVVQRASPGSQEEWSITVRHAQDHEDPTIDALDIPAIMGMSSHERISLLKIDIEGAEHAVFGGDTTSWLGQVDNIAIELHGDLCRSVFLAAVAGQDFTMSESGELTVCRRRSSLQPSGR